MPTKDPGLWATIIEFIRSVDMRGINVAFYAAAVAFLRIAFDERERRWQRVILEVLLAALLAKGAEQAAVAFGYSHIDIAIGAAIGFIGVDNLRYFGKKYFSKRIEGENGKL